MSPDAFAAYTPPGGESLEHMQKRVLVCIHRLAIENPRQTVLVVAHDGTINAIRASFTGEKICEAATVSHAHDFVAKFVVKSGKVTSFAEISP